MVTTQIPVETLQIQASATPCNSSHTEDVSLLYTLLLSRYWHDEPKQVLHSTPCPNLTKGVFSNSDPFQLEETQEALWFNLPLQTGTAIRLEQFIKALPSWVKGIYILVKRHGGYTSLGIPFHCLSNLIVKKIQATSSCNLSCFFGSIHGHFLSASHYGRLWSIWHQLLVHFLISTEGLLWLTSWESWLMSLTSCCHDLWLSGGQLQLGEPHFRPLEEITKEVLLDAISRHMKEKVTGNSQHDYILQLDYFGDEITRSVDSKLWMLSTWALAGLLIQLSALLSVFFLPFPECKRSCAHPSTRLLVISIRMSLSLQTSISLAPSAFKFKIPATCWLLSWSLKPE